MDNIKEQIARMLALVYEGCDWDDLCQEMADETLSLEIVKEGGECPECRGKTKILDYPYHGSVDKSWVQCPSCNGYGKLPDEKRTLLEWVKKGMGEK